MSLLTAAAILTLVADPRCGGLPRDGVMAQHVVATALTESGDGHGHADPLAIHVNADAGGERAAVVLHPASVEEAIAQARTLAAAGRSFDVGLMQINNASMAHDGLTVETAFDTCRNVAAGVAHFSGDVQAVLDAAHRRYNTGSTERGARYAAAVEATLARMQAGPGGAIIAAPLAPPAPPPCAPEWDAWALAECSARTAPLPGPPPVDGASSTTITASNKELTNAR